MLFPGMRWSAPKMLRIGRRLVRLLIPDVNAIQALEAFTPIQSALQDSQTAVENAREAVKVARGHKAAAADALFAQVRILALRILGIHGNRHNGAIYREYFPEGYGSVRKGSPEEIMLQANGLITALESETHPELAALRQIVQAAYETAQQQSAAYVAALTALADAKALREKAKLDWRQAYMRLYYNMRDVYFDRRNHVEALFRLPGRRDVGGEEEENEENEDIENAGLEEEGLGLEGEVGSVDRVAGSRAGSGSSAGSDDADGNVDSVDS